MLQSKEQVGKLDRRILFQKKVIGVNASNEYAETGWEDIEIVPRVWSRVEDLSGTEQYQADKLTALGVSRFTIRYREDLDEEMRIVFGGYSWDILAILPDTERKGYLRITAERGGEFVGTLGEFNDAEFSNDFAVG